MAVERKIGGIHSSSNLASVLNLSDDVTQLLHAAAA